MERWGEYFQDLLNENGQTSCVDEETREIGPCEEEDFIGDDELEEAIWST